MELFTELMKSCHGLRRLGSAAVDLAYTACGRFEAFYEYNLNRLGHCSRSIDRTAGRRRSSQF